MQCFKSLHISLLLQLMRPLCFCRHTIKALNNLNTPMKKVIFLLFVTAHVYGQSIDYNKIILPDHVQNPDFAEKLVQLAWKNNPVNEILRREIKRNEYQVKRNAGQWLDIISMQGNLNEFNLNAQNQM